MHYNARVVGESVDIEVVELQWDGPIVTHIARHDVSRGDVEYALANNPLFFMNLPGQSATHLMIGRDGRDRILYVPILMTVVPGRWLVVSAWESRFARRLYEGR